jgi:hypothetical protein
VLVLYLVRYGSLFRARQRIPTECGVSESNRGASIMWRPCSAGACLAMVKKVEYSHYRPSGLWGSGRLRLQNF